MSEFDSEQFDSLIAAGKYDEAKSLLENYFNGEITAEERGALLANLAMVYLKVNNDISKKYLDELKYTIASLKEVDEIERKSGEDSDIADIRKQISQF